MLIAQAPYKKKVQVGDVFSLKFKHGFIFGQVVAQDIPFAGFERCQHKVVIFRGTYQNPSEWDHSLSSSLLMPPYYLNNLGFSRGYMPVVGNAPPVKLHPEIYCYKDFRKGFVDESGNPCAQRPLVGEHGFGNYLTLSEHIEPHI